MQTDQKYTEFSIYQTSREVDFRPTGRTRPVLRIVKDATVVSDIAHHKPTAQELQAMYPYPGGRA